MENKAEFYLQAMKDLERADNEIKELFIQMQVKDFGYDFLLAIGIARRSCALTSGFKSMLEAKNSLCALALVRMQLDNSLRLYAGFFSKDRMKFSKDVLNGKIISKMKADDNQPMTDNYLARRVSTKNPWVINVYKKTSGYIHFSEEHIKEALRHNGGSNYEIVIGPNDFDRNEEHFLEPLQCFTHITMMIKVQLEDWLGLLDRNKY
ncbi:Uncharacterised protein [Klebsiella pneumoniae]|uniref:hypothetical protein n=1 Tax=Klebsiella pneumoniae TaxID=573 RepID=UPI00108459B5|nr:hypothetical protein [Klebsiella pneumoniae]VFZ87489.1 Uncharacterised protein [Klebsiella pneumoniae]VGA16306.1 Uncharacterised protein [Klebsiella pneumoniae]